MTIAKDGAPERRPRLLVLTTTFPRWDGDSEPPFVFELSRRLAAAFDVTVLAPRAPGAAERETMAGLAVIRYPYFLRSLEQLAYRGGILANIRAHPWRLLLAPLLVLGLFRVLARLLKDQSFDVVHAHWLIPQAWVATCVARGGKPPIVATSHGGDLYGLRGFLWDRLRRAVIRRSHAVTVVSEPMAEQLRRTHADIIDRISVIPMGVDLAGTFVPGPAPREHDQLLFVGRLVPKKGCDVLIRAMGVLSARGTTAQLLIGGDGPERAALERLAQQVGVADQVQFLGAVANADLPARYRGAAALVAPFLEAPDGDRDSFGLVLVEAMGCDCPVVTTRLALVNPAVRENATAWVAETGDAEALADAIAGVLANPQEARRRSAAARALALSRFDWSVISARYADLLLPLATR